MYLQCVLDLLGQLMIESSSLHHFCDALVFIDLDLQRLLFQLYVENENKPCLLLRLFIFLPSAAARVKYLAMAVFVLDLGALV